MNWISNMYLGTNIGKKQKLTWPWPLVPKVISCKPKISTEPPKLAKSTFWGPLSFKWPTGLATSKELPGPDLIFWVSMLELNWIPPISENQYFKEKTSSKNYNFLVYLPDIFIFLADMLVSVGVVLKIIFPAESIITNLLEAKITSFSLMNNAEECFIGELATNDKFLKAWIINPL